MRLLELDEGKIREFLSAAARGGKPTHHTYLRLAEYLVQLAEPELAASAYKAFLQVEKSADVYSLYLQAILLSPLTDNRRLLKETTEFAATFYPQYRVQRVFKKQAPPPRLKVGFICHFFTNSVGLGLFIPLLGRLVTRDELDVYIYNDGDSLPKDYEGKWRNTRGLTHEQFASLVRRDMLDIAIEMNGHVVNNRFSALSSRPAQIQVSWFNWAGTTGLPFIDYIIADPVLVPTSDDPYYVETVARLPKVAGVYGISNPRPPVAPPPRDRNGYLTFGCFGASHKLNDRLLSLWARVLKAVPNSRLLLKNGTLSFENGRRIFAGKFAALGIGEDRLLMRGFSPYGEMLEEYADVDIALDTWPHAGGATTTEAMWQGVPILSLTGDRYASRNGELLLNMVGLPELVARSESDFLALSVGAAKDGAWLRKTRRELRGRLQSSAYTDVDQYSSDLTALLRSLYR